MGPWTTSLVPLAAVRDEWEHLADSAASTPFAYPGWFEAWADSFEESLEILTVRRNGVLEGVLPIRMSRGRVKSVTNSHTPLYEPISSDDEAERRLVEGALAHSSSQLEFSYLRRGESFAQTLLSVATERSFSIRQTSFPEAFIHTDGDWRAYERGIHRRRSVLQHLRQLRKAGSLNLVVSDGTEGLGAILEEGFRIEGSGWKADNGTAINLQADRLHFYTEVARWASERGWLRLVLLQLDGVGLAFDFAIDHGGVHHILKTGYDAEFSRLGPGSVMRYLTIEDAFANPEIRIYNMLGSAEGSHNKWKLNWTDQSRTLTEISAFAPTPLGRLELAKHEIGDRVRRLRVRVAETMSPELKARVKQLSRPTRGRGRRTE